MRQTLEGARPIITRREAIRAALFGAALAASPRLVQAQAAPLPAARAPTGPFVVPSLPYDDKALEPYIDAQTMQIHHDKHHQAYVTNLNKAVAKYPDLQKKTVEELITGLDVLPADIRTAVRNNGGGHFNHSDFWAMMRPGPNRTALGLSRPNAPTGDLLTAINAKFGSFANFQQQFMDAAVKQFGSGWAWLSVSGSDSHGELRVESTPNQDSPLMFGRVPLLGVDVWEHAYYLKYQNRRPEYVAAWFNVVNWDFVADRFLFRRA